jgi:hypothetical protein
VQASAVARQRLIDEAPGRRGLQWNRVDSVHRRQA